MNNHKKIVKMRHKHNFWVVNFKILLRTKSSKKKLKYFYSQRRIIAITCCRLNIQIRIIYTFSTHRAFNRVVFKSIKTIIQYIFLQSIVLPISPEKKNQDDDRENHCAVVSFALTISEFLNSTDFSLKNFVMFFEWRKTALLIDLIMLLIILITQCWM